MVRWQASVNAPTARSLARASTAAVPPSDPTRSVPWTAGALLLFLVGLPSPLPAQSPEPDLSALRAQARQDPESALRAVRRLLESAVAPARRLQLLRVEAEALALAGRRAEAEDRYQKLSSAGEDVLEALCALRGLRLSVARFAQRSPGEVRVHLDGVRTGLLSLVLYRVDASALAARVQAATHRSVWSHLRAPPPATLRRLVAWTEKALDGAREFRLPRPLDEGLYLLTASARGVTARLPVLVSRARALALADAPGGLLWVADADTGDPLEGALALAHDEEGRLLGPCGPSDAQGLLRAPAASRWVSVWQEQGPLLVAVPTPPALPPPATGPRLRPDRRRARAGEALLVRASGITDRDPASSLGLLAPGGEGALRSVPATPDRYGEAWISLTLPFRLPRGRWSLGLGAGRCRVEARPPAPPIRLSVEAPPALAGATALPAVLRARLAGSGRSVSETLRWTLWTAPAASDPHAPADPSPLPRFAFGPTGPLRRDASGEVCLDERGEARLSIPLPELEAPRAYCLLVEGRGGLLAEGAEGILGPSPLVLLATPARRLAAPGDVVPLAVRSLRLDGRPAAHQDFVLEVTHGGRTERSQLRTDGAGAARTNLVRSEEGEVSIALRAHDRAGRARSSTTSLWLVRAHPTLPPSADGIRLVLEPRTGELLARFPFASGRALLVRRRGGRAEASLRGVRGAALRAMVRGGTTLEVHAFWRGHHLKARAVRPPARPAPLPVRLRCAEGPFAPGQDLGVSVETGPAGRGRAARGWLSLHAEADARVRRRWPEGQGPWRVPPLDGASLATNGAGRGRAVLRAPTAPGRYWLRAEARDAAGRRGVGWRALEVRAPVEVALHAPSTLVAGDRSELTCRIRCRGPATLLPDGRLRVSWTARGLTVGRPRLEGTHALLDGTGGAGGIELAAAPELRVRLPLTATRPGEGRLLVSAQLVGEPLGASATHEIAIRPRGLTEFVRLTGEVSPGKSQEVRIALPDGARPGSGVLELCVDPGPATAALAAARSLARRPGLRSALAAHLAAASLRDLAKELRLACPLPKPPPLDEVWARLLGARRAGRLPAGLAPALGALARRGTAVPAGLPRADAHVPVDPRTLEGRAELLATLSRRDQSPRRRRELLHALLAARSGSGWSDPDTSRAAVEGLVALASRRGAPARARARAYLEDELLLDAFSGSGLAEWRGTVRRAGVSHRSRLRVTVLEAPGPVHWSVRVAATVPSRGAAPRERGLSFALRLQAEGGSPAPPRWRVGQTLHLELVPSGPAWLELPLPGGLTPLELPPELEARGGSLVGEISSAPLRLQLLCSTPGEYVWLPARLRSLAKPDREAVGAERNLFVDP